MFFTVYATAASMIRKLNPQWERWGELYCDWKASVVAGAEIFSSSVERLGRRSGAHYLFGKMLLSDAHGAEAPSVGRNALEGHTLDFSTKVAAPRAAYNSLHHLCRLLFFLWPPVMLLSHSELATLCHTIAQVLLAEHLLPFFSYILQFVCLGWIGHCAWHCSFKGLVEAPWNKSNQVP